MNLRDTFAAACCAIGALLPIPAFALGIAPGSIVAAPSVTTVGVPVVFTVTEPRGMNMLPGATVEFGDGTGQHITPAGGMATVVHAYARPGRYVATVSFMSSFVYEAVVTVNGPVTPAPPSDGRGGALDARLSWPDGSSSVQATSQAALPRPVARVLGYRGPATVTFYVDGAPRASTPAVLAVTGTTIPFIAPLPSGGGRHTLSYRVSYQGASGLSSALSPTIDYALDASPAPVAATSLPAYLHFNGFDVAVVRGSRNADGTFDATGTVAVLGARETVAFRGLRLAAATRSTVIVPNADGTGTQSNASISGVLGLRSQDDLTVDRVNAAYTAWQNAAVQSNARASISLDKIYGGAAYSTFIDRGYTFGIAGVALGAVGTPSSITLLYRPNTVGAMPLPYTGGSGVVFAATAGTPFYGEPTACTGLTPAKGHVTSIPSAVQHGCVSPPDAANGVLHVPITLSLAVRNIDEFGQTNADVAFPANAKFGGSGDVNWLTSSAPGAAIAFSFGTPQIDPQPSSGRASGSLTARGVTVAVAPESVTPTAGADSLSAQIDERWNADGSVDFDHAFAGNLPFPIVAPQSFSLAITSMNVAVHESSAHASDVRAGFSAGLDNGRTVTGSVDGTLDACGSYTGTTANVTPIVDGGVTVVARSARLKVGTADWEGCNSNSSAESYWVNDPFWRQATLPPHGAPTAVPKLDDWGLNVDAGTVSTPTLPSPVSFRSQRSGFGYGGAIVTSAGTSAAMTAVFYLSGDNARTSIDGFPYDLASLALFEQGGTVTTQTATGTLVIPQPVGASMTAYGTGTNADGGVASLFVPKATRIALAAWKSALVLDDDAFSTHHTLPIHAAVSIPLLPSLDASGALLPDGHVQGDALTASPGNAPVSRAGIDIDVATLVFPWSDSNAADGPPGIVGAPAVNGWSDNGKSVEIDSDNGILSPPTDYKMELRQDIGITDFDVFLQYTPNTKTWTGRGRSKTADGVLDLQLALLLDRHREHVEIGGNIGKITNEPGSGNDATDGGSLSLAELQGEADFDRASGSLQHLVVAGALTVDPLDAAVVMLYRTDPTDGWVSTNVSAASSDEAHAVGFLQQHFENYCTSDWCFAGNVNATLNQDAALSGEAGFGRATSSGGGPSGFAFYVDAALQTSLRPKPFTGMAAGDFDQHPTAWDMELGVGGIPIFGVLQAGGNLCIWDHRETNSLSAASCDFADANQGVDLVHPVPERGIGFGLGVGVNVAMPNQDPIISGSGALALAGSTAGFEGQLGVAASARIFKVDIGDVGGYFDLKYPPWRFNGNVKVDTCVAGVKLGGTFDVAAPPTSVDLSGVNVGVCL